MYFIKELPAFENTNEKHGMLKRKGKTFFIETQKTYFGKICKNWFLLYNTNKSIKPSETYDLKRYIVQCLNEDNSFNLQLKNNLKEKPITVDL